MGGRGSRYSLKKSVFTQENDISATNLEPLKLGEGLKFFQIVLC